MTELEEREAIYKSARFATTKNPSYEGDPVVLDHDVHRVMRMIREKPITFAAEITLPNVPYMVSGQGNQQSIKLYKHIRSGDMERGFGDWYIGQVENEGDFIYYRKQGNYISEGFAGARLTFPVEGGSVEIQGPWHGNSHSLYRETGYDVRMKHYTRVVLGLKPHANFYSGCQVIWNDDTQRVLGPHSRGEQLAQILADRYGVTIYGWQASEGGGCSLRAEPQ